MLDEYDPRRARGGRPWQRIVQWMKANAPNVCHLCGDTIDLALRWPDPRSFSVDHIVPLDAGGHPTDVGNLAPAHLGCNAAKGARAEWNTDRASNTSTEW